MPGMWYDNQLPPVSSGGAAQSILSGREGDPSVFKKWPTSSGISVTQSFQLQPDLLSLMMRTSDSLIARRDGLALAPRPSVM